MSSRILCVNCGICVNRIARHIVLEQDTRVVSYIAKRISPRIITESNNICQACLDAVMMRVNQIIHGESNESNKNQLPGNKDTQVVGHSKVCIICGISILRRKSDLLLRSNPTELQQMIATVIMNSIESQEILPYVDGFNHVSKIAALTDVEISLVRACVQNLVYYGVVTLVPIFQYCAVYSATPKLRQLTRCVGLQRQCIEFCARSPRQLPKVNDLFRMYAGMSYGSTIRDLCRRMKPQELAINERKLVLFGVLEGLIRRVYKYPVTLNNEESGSVHSGHSSHSSAPARTYSGLGCLDELCCQAGLSAAQLEEQLERDTNVIFIVK